LPNDVLDTIVVYVPYVVIYSTRNDCNSPLWFQNPQADLQAQDRCHRMGQEKPVVVYRLCSKNTVDEKILDRASAKRKLEKIIIGSGKSYIVQLFPYFVNSVPGGGVASMLVVNLNKIYARNVQKLWTGFKKSFNLNSRKRTYFRVCVTTSIFFPVFLIGKKLSSLTSLIIGIM